MVDIGIFHDLSVPIYRKFGKGESPKQGRLAYQQSPGFHPKLGCICRLMLQKPRFVLVELVEVWLLVKMIA